MMFQHQYKFAYFANLSTAAQSQINNIRTLANGTDTSLNTLSNNDISIFKVSIRVHKNINLILIIHPI